MIQPQVTAPHSMSRERVRFEHDQDADVSYLDQPEFSDISANDIVSYVAIYERACDMGEWHTVDAVGGCDIMRSDDAGFDGCAYAPTDVPEPLAFAVEHFDILSGPARPTGVTMFRSIADIKQANRDLGHHFFDADTLHFFNSKVCDELFGAEFFVTSEKGPDEIRRYTVRRALESGAVETMGDFGAYPTLEAAKRAARSFADDVTMGRLS